MRFLFKIGLLFLLPLSVIAQQRKSDSLNQALDIAENDSVRMELLNGLYLFYADSDRDSAMFFTDLALVKSREINQPLWTAYLLINKAYLLQRQGNLSLSFKLLNEAKELHSLSICPLMHEYDLFKDGCSNSNLGLPFGPHFRPGSTGKKQDWA